MATDADMRDSPFRYALDGASETYVNATLARASRNIESRCARRFTPFYGLVQSERAEGVALDAVGGVDVPMSMTSTLALSRAQAYGGSAGNLVRDIWLDERPPMYPELWTYSDVSVAITAPFGGGPQVFGGPGTTGAAGLLEGPQTDTGHLRLPFGAYCPVGSTIATTYSGGYTEGFPDDLVQATIMQAVKLMILTIAPERRQSLTTEDLDAEIDVLIAPYARA
jgi:hypothetical protein